MSHFDTRARAPASAFSNSDAAPADGHWLSYGIIPEADYVALELSPNMRDLASTRLAARRTRLQLLDQDIDASLPEGPFDLVVSFFAIHHLEKPVRQVRCP
ncbi:MAG: methyltransferase domain-containing protein [Luteitalea sp.]|nr:methyltransferase domain-containing protein [Luteitalea sp.]